MFQTKKSIQWAFGIALASILGLSLACSPNKATSGKVTPVEFAPQILRQPQSLTVNSGQEATFDLSATSTVAMTCQWTKNGVALTNGGRISGATDWTLRIVGTQVSDAGVYACAVSSSLNGATKTTISSNATLSVNPPVATHFAVAGFTSPTNPGVSHTFTVTALDASNATVPGYTGTVHFSSSDGAAVIPANYTFVATDSGSHSFSATLNTTGTQSLTATDLAVANITGSQAGITVNPPPATHFTVTGYPSPTTMGVVHSFTVTALDASNQVVPTYSGTVSFSSTDAAAVIPANYTFVASDNGAHTFNATLNTAGTQSLGVADTLTASLNGVQTNISVQAPPATHLRVSGYPSPTTVGASHAITVTALDASNNVVPAYIGTVHFTSTDVGAVLPADYTFTAADSGTHSFSVSFNTVGTQALTATDTVTASITGSQASITVNAGAATHLTITGFPSPASPGASNFFTVTALDSQNNTATGYTGTVHFTSTDGAAVLPANYTFQAADAGIHSFNATLTTAGAQTLTATDTVAASITGSSASISVSAVAPSILVQPQTKTVVPPDAVTFTVTAQANNGGTLSYVWKKNGTAISGQTSASYTVSSTEFPTNTDAYSVTVSEGGLSTDSDTVYALASVPSPAYAGDPVPVPSRPITVLPSLHVDAVNFPNGAFRLGYDEALKNPVWTAYVNFPVKLPYANSTADYTADTRLQAPQVGKTDYNGLYTSGANAPDSYDRGHQVPRADISYRYTPVAGDDATIMSNLVPQISQFNQQTWQKLEDAIGGNGGGSTDGLTSFKGRVWVYTGSVFPATPTWWNSQVTPGLKIAIPVSCYKIVVHEVTPGHPEVLAMLMPNVWGLPNSMTTLTSYVTSVARIEALTGLDFFPNLATVAPTLDIPTWKATVDVRGWRTPFEQATGPNVHVIRPSYDETVDEGTTVDFDGAATTPSGAAVGTTIASTTWNFGDATPTTTGYATTHLYTTAGTYNATFTASDSLGGANTITRVIRVIPPASSNAAPTTTPAVLPDKTTLVDQALTVNFTVSDDRTPAGSLLVAASSDNATLLPVSGIVVSNNSGAASLVLTPAVGQIGSATITVTITDGDSSVTTRTFLFTVNAPAANTLSEGFETGTKGSYAAAAATLGTGSWTLTDALIAKSTSNGGSASDHFNGLQGCRIQNAATGTATGKVTMGFDYSFGAQSVSISIAQYNTDSAAPGTLGLWYSTDQGGSWTQAAGTVTPASTTPVTYTWTVGVNAPIRIELRRTDTISKGRICLDDIVINGY